ncbi:hypothetical protein TSOC_004002 [Tetrabaena socialis]|uniref:Uncharacterized protein n=1 Tax=Tetrabaena socialis TaxID=47790 RepID=A0A2J8AA16_9CHLO|nr:hypothetical protein TSOC_004002 [Tetrabaena socialis]|eukprot:PNH09360.1 hypothetical protein TSOC_004002 [Tetrabaena socialis]
MAIRAGATTLSPTVALYMSETPGVDLKWDRGPQNLQRQLVDQGFELSIGAGDQPVLTGEQPPVAYVIPAPNGYEAYSSAEDMDEVAAFVASGGLVVVLDAGHEAAVRDFAAKALRYTGDWSVCKAPATTGGLRSSDSPLGGPVLSPRASLFLRSDVVWPETLEDARITTMLTGCRHEDADSVAVPLYTMRGDDSKTVALAFGKAGTRGAVVWLGYSWKDGAQAKWGSLLRKLITAFADGLYEVPSAGDPQPLPAHPSEEQGNAPDDTQPGAQPRPSPPSTDCVPAGANTSDNTVVFPSSSHGPAVTCVDQAACLNVRYSRDTCVSGTVAGAAVLDCNVCLFWDNSRNCPKTVGNSFGHVCSGDLFYSTLLGAGRTPVTGATNKFSDWSGGSSREWGGGLDRRHGSGTA